MEQQNKQNVDLVQNPKRINWVTIAIMIVVLLIFGGIMYYCQKSIVKSFEQNIQEQISELQGKLTLIQQELGDKDGGSDNKEIVYSNSEYGFSLTFPDTWKGYIAKNKTLNWGSFGTSDSIDFGFLAQESLLKISIHKKQQWQQIQSEEGPKPSYLGENNEYIFGYSQGQYVANDDMLARAKEVNSIIKTFEIE